MEQRQPRRRSATPWFLATPPDIQSEWLARGRLSEAIEQLVAAHPLVLLEAPSGYGKTTALAIWASTRAASTAWLALTAHDEDPAQLFSGILTALLRVHPEHAALAVLSAQHHDGELHLEQAVQHLIQTVIESDMHTVLVLDDAHLTSQHAFAQIISPLVQHARGHLRLVLCATQRISAWCARLLAYDNARALPHELLAFTPEEVETLFAQISVSGRVTSPDEQANALTPEGLWSQTQGWPVAVLLTLAAGSVEHLTPATQQDVITEYIETAVLGSLRPELQHFILAAVTCNRLAGGLAVELSGSSDAPLLLEECRQRGLFLESFNQTSSETVYRWHATFAHHCRAIQLRRDGAVYRKRHRVAARWLSTLFPAEAVTHAVAADDASLARSILEENWLQMVSGGQAGVLATACTQVPPPVRDTPMLLLIRACCLDVKGDRSGASMLAKQAEAVLLASQTDEQDRYRTAQAFASLFLEQRHEHLQDAADRAHHLLTGTAMSTSQYLHGLFLLGWTELRLRRDPARAIQLLSTAAKSAGEAGYDVLAARASANLSFALAFGGRLTAAQTALGQLTHQGNLGEWNYYDGGIEVMSAIFIAYWRNELQTVIKLGRDMHERGGHSASYSALGRIYFAFAAAESQSPILHTEATKMLARVSTVEVHGVPWPTYAAIARAKLAMARSDHARAALALRQIGDRASIPTTLAMAAEVYQQLGQSDHAREMLRGIARTELVSYVYVSAQLTMARVAWDKDDRVEAHKALERSLNVAVAENVILPFSRLDATTRDLLTRHASSGTGYEGFIAARLATESSGINRSEVISTPLSSREREVFGYLGTTMTADEIAAALHVSVNTIRSHQRSIYRKLGVTTRREAIRVHL